MEAAKFCGQIAKYRMRRSRREAYRSASRNRLLYSVYPVRLHVLHTGTSVETETVSLAVSGLRIKRPDNRVRTYRELKPRLTAHTGSCRALRISRPNDRSFGLPGWIGNADRVRRQSHPGGRSSRSAPTVITRKEPATERSEGPERTHWCQGHLSRIAGRGLLPVQSGRFGHRGDQASPGDCNGTRRSVSMI